MKTEETRKISKFKVAVFLYICASAYPAYVQSAEWANAALDSFAADRLGLTLAQAKTYNTLADAMEGHPATKMQGAKDE